MVDRHTARLRPRLVADRRSIKRREFVGLLGGSAVASSMLWSRASRAQSPAIPVIGLLSGVSFDPGAGYADRVVAFRQGLKESGFVEGQNVAIEYRTADGQFDRVPALVANLVRRKVVLIVAMGTSEPALAAKAASATMVQQRIAAAIVSTDAVMNGWRDQIARLAARHGVPVIYSNREFVLAGGLISYAPELYDHFRVAGTYAGRILKGEKPADLPVQLPTKFELVLNLKAAKALGLTIPMTLQVAATEVIE